MLHAFIKRNVKRDCQEHDIINHAVVHSLGPHLSRMKKAVV